MNTVETRNWTESTPSKFRYKAKVKGKSGEQRKARKETCHGAVRVALVTMWKMFDFPCGARLVSLLKTETDRMRKLGELVCSDDVAKKLQAMVASTIDEKLKHEKEVERQKRSRLTLLHKLHATHKDTSYGEKISLPNKEWAQIHMYLCPHAVSLLHSPRTVFILVPGELPSAPVPPLVPATNL